MKQKAAKNQAKATGNPYRENPYREELLKQLANNPDTLKALNATSADIIKQTSKLYHSFPPTS